MKLQCEKKELFWQYCLPVIIEFALLGLLMWIFRFFADMGPFISEYRMVGESAAKPTLGRAVFGSVSLILAVLGEIWGAGCAKRGEITKAFWIGFVSGILLWQSVGEIAWQFGVGGRNFVRLESIDALPAVVLFAGLLLYGICTDCFDFGTWSLILSFGANWLGHYIMIGLYPFAEDLLAQRTFNVGVSLIVGGAVLLHSLWRIVFTKTDKKTRLLTSVETYIAVSVIFFGLVKG